MNIRPFEVWLVLANGNPYSWHLSRSAAFAERRMLNDKHLHARWTVEKTDAELQLAKPVSEEAAS